MTKKQKQRPHIGRCIRIAGNVPAGIILYRLMVWNSTRVIKGRPMFAKSHDDLMWETGLSYEQVKAGVAVIRREKLASIERALFHGKPVNHYMLTSKFGELFASDQVKFKLDEMVENTLSA